MSTPKHPTPWRIARDCKTIIRDAHGCAVASTGGRYDGRRDAKEMERENRDLAVRIVNAVNKELL